MAFTDQATLAVDVVFIGRVKVAVAKTALDVYNEPSSVQGHEQRSNFAQHVLRLDTGVDLLTRLIWGVVADTSITSASTDQNIADRLAAIWNAFAGA